MTNLLLYIQALPCHSLMTLLQHAKVEGNTVYVSNEDYEDAYHDFDLRYDLEVMTILDTIIHDKFNCPYFQFIEYRIRYYWNEEKRQYISGQVKQ